MDKKIHSLLVRIYDILVREPRMIWHHYRPCSFCVKREDIYIFMVDGVIPHGGMFDRLKGMITIYAIAKKQGKKFKLHFTYPFRLEEYLEPNTYDWRIADEEIYYSYPVSRPVIAYGEIDNPSRLLKNRHQETHFYYGYNSLEEVNKYYNTDYEWGNLYCELFKPTPRLQQYIDKYRAEIGKEYIVIHTRFLNLLGDKVETAINPELSDGDKCQLIALCQEEIGRIIHLEQAKKPCRLMLASDSMTFIYAMQQTFPDAYVVPGEVRHIDTAGQTADDEKFKNVSRLLSYRFCSQSL